MLRPVDDRDVFALYRWRCDPETCRFAKTVTPPTWEEHMRWFMRRLPLPDWHIGVEALTGPSVGVVRFDESIVSITVDPLLRGRWHGRWLLKVGTEAFQKAHPGVQIVAQIYRLNVSSQRIFGWAGYRRVTNGDWEEWRKSDTPVPTPPIFPANRIVREGGLA